jgi:hypothetical protein
VSVAVAASREYVEVWRTDDCAAYESVYVDKNGVTCSELVIWSADGSRHREVIGGADLTTIRRDWEAASPFDKVLVPEGAGRKVWTHLDAPRMSRLLLLLRVLCPLQTRSINLPLLERERTLWIPLLLPVLRRIGRSCAGLVSGSGQQMSDHAGAVDDVSAAARGTGPPDNFPAPRLDC